jgi:hypothetical protein
MWLLCCINCCKTVIVLVFLNRSMFFDLGCVLDALAQGCSYMLRCQMCYSLSCLSTCVHVWGVVAVRSALHVRSKNKYYNSFATVNTSQKLHH